jgi:hypothetical protein
MFAISMEMITWGLARLGGWRKMAVPNGMEPAQNRSRVILCQHPNRLYRR